MITSADDRLRRSHAEPKTALLAELLAAHDARTATRTTSGFNGRLAARARQSLPTTTAETEVIRIVQIARYAIHSRLAASCLGYYLD